MVDVCVDVLDAGLVAPEHPGGDIGEDQEEEQDQEDVRMLQKGILYIPLLGASSVGSVCII